MLICVKCATDMGCEKNDVLVARDPHHVQAADLYKCPECGFELLTGASNPAEWKYANKIYNRRIEKYRDLYRLDTREFFKGEAVDVG